MRWSVFKPWLRPRGSVVLENHRLFLHLSLPPIPHPTGLGREVARKAGRPHDGHATVLEMHPYWLRTHRIQVIFLWSLPQHCDSCKTPRKEGEESRRRGGSPLGDLETQRCPLLSAQLRSRVKGSRLPTRGSLGTSLPGDGHLLESALWC